MWVTLYWLSERQSCSRSAPQWTPWRWEKISQGDFQFGYPGGSNPQLGNLLPLVCLGTYNPIQVGKRKSPQCDRAGTHQSWGSLLHFTACLFTLSFVNKQLTMMLTKGALYSTVTQLSFSFCAQRTIHCTNRGPIPRFTGALHLPGVPLTPPSLIVILSFPLLLVFHLVFFPLSSKS